MYALYVLFEPIFARRDKTADDAGIANSKVHCVAVVRQLVLAHRTEVAQVAVEAYTLVNNQFVGGEFVFARRCEVTVGTVVPEIIYMYIYKYVFIYTETTNSVARL